MNLQDKEILMNNRELKSIYKESFIDYGIENFIDELLEEIETFPEDFKNTDESQIKLSTGSYSEELICEYFKELLNEF